MEGKGYMGGQRNNRRQGLGLRPARAFKKVDSRVYSEPSYSSPTECCLHKALGTRGTWEMVVVGRLVEAACG